MKQQIVKPLLDGLFSDQEAWKNFQEMQKEKRRENILKIQAFIQSGLKNDWLNRSIDIEDGDFVCEDFLEINNFVILESLEQLKAELDYENWGINTAFIYNNFAFINQRSGGGRGEWAVFKYIKEENKAFQFESWTGSASEDFQEFKQTIIKLEKATNEQLKKLEF